MDETEVQVEIACWAQDHPEVSSINWNDGIEPWVSFRGKRCTVYVGLGGLTWSIEVPSGYQTEVDPEDGKRKRLWEPFEYRDVVIVQSKSTPFLVSVTGLEGDSLRAGEIMEGDEQEQKKIGDLRKTLLRSQLQGDGNADDGLRHSVKFSTEKQFSEETELSLTKSNTSFETLKTAETLAEVLDAILELVKLYGKHQSSTVDLVASQATGTHVQHGKKFNETAGEDDADILECNEDDDHLFEPEMAVKWSWIADQVNYARHACEAFRPDGPHCSSWCDDIVSRFPISTKLKAAEESSHQMTKVNGQTLDCKTDEILRINFQNLDCDADGEDIDNSWEMTSFLDVEEVVGVKDSRLPQVNSSVKSGKVVQTHSTQENEVMFGSVELVSPLEFDLSSRKALEMPSTVQHQDCLTDKADPADEESDGDLKLLQWCDIFYNSKSFSVECTIQLSGFMDLVLATALGFTLDHPLRVEIVPKKDQIESLGWNGAVDVYVSQQSDWHNHVSEEICGLLCLVPYIVQNFFDSQLPVLMCTKTEHKGDLFIGVLQTLVRRLMRVNKGNSCCVCARVADRPLQLFLRSKSVWPCGDNFCQVTYTTWLDVSSVDRQERDSEDWSNLLLVEERLRDNFPFDCQEALKLALDVYSVDTDKMNYLEMIRALARIEVWDLKDPDTPCSEALFRFE